jgi:hypothetical protein
LNRNESGRFGALKSDSTHHFFRNACTKSGSLRFSQFSGCWLILSVYIIMHIHFIPVSGCVGRGPRSLLCLRAYNTVKTTLIIGTCHSGVRQFLQLYVDFQGAVSEYRDQDGVPMLVGPLGNCPVCPYALLMIIIYICSQVLYL